MPVTDSIPTRLPVLPDDVLLRTILEYRYALQLLTGGTAVSRSLHAANGHVGDVTRTVRDAVGVLEAEGEERGLHSRLEEMSRFLAARVGGSQPDSSVW